MHHSNSVQFLSHALLDLLFECLQGKRLLQKPHVPPGQDRFGMVIGAVPTGKEHPGLRIDGFQPVKRLPAAHVRHDVIPVHGMQLQTKATKTTTVPWITEMRLQADTFY